MKKFSVYKHTFPNGKVYIGITSQNPPDRWKNGLGYKKQSYLFSKIVKYGWENIKSEILFKGLNKTRAKEIERKLIIDYKSTDREFGYNTILPHWHNLNYNLSNIPVYGYIDYLDENGIYKIEKFIG